LQEFDGAWKPLSGGQADGFLGPSLLCGLRPVWVCGHSTIDVDSSPKLTDLLRKDGVFLRETLDHFVHKLERYSIEGSAWTQHMSKVSSFLTDFHTF